MKTSIITGIMLTLLAGNAFAECDLNEKTVTFQQELQKTAINNPEKMERISEKLEQFSDEFIQIAEERTSDPQRLNRICAKLDEMLKLLQE